MKPQSLNDPDQRLGAQTGKRAGGPVRQCAVTRERLAPDALIRFVRSPDGVVVPDVFGKLPGRGAWVTADRQTLAKGMKQGTLCCLFLGPVQPMGKCDLWE